MFVIRSWVCCKIIIYTSASYIYPTL